MIINGRFLTQRVTGVQRFAHEVIRAATVRGTMTAADTRLIMPVQQEAVSDFFGLPVRQMGRHQGHRWEQFELPAAAGDELLVNLCNTGPLLRERQMVVLHDAAVAANPRNFTLAFRAWYQVMIRAYGFRARRIGTVSRYSAQEIAKYFGISASKIEVIPESGEHILRETADDSIHRQFGLEPDSYFLAVSSLAPNKNFSAVLKAVSRLPSMPFKFVIVGGKNARIFSANGMDIADAIEVGYVSDAQLRALYEQAACFVYPSLYEGFGLPPLEAMNCGCPVLVSATTSLPEVCGEAGVYCDPYNVEDIAEKLGKLLGSREYRAERREAGFARAREWTWEKAALRLQEVAAGL